MRRCIELAQLAQQKNNTPVGSLIVIDGEILVCKNDSIQNFNVLQKRLGKKAPSKKFVAERPGIIMVYDILELEGEDFRELPQESRREKLENLFHLNKDISQWKLSNTKEG